MTPTPSEVRQELGAKAEPAWERLPGDELAQQKFQQLREASPETQPELMAQFETYLAAAHAIFPEEVKVIYLPSGVNSD